MCGMNNNALKYPKHRAAVMLSAPIGKAFAVACKNRGFPFALGSKTHRYIGFDGKHGYLKLAIFNQTSANAAKIIRSNHQMPIAQRPS
jgi:hypothetical protein